MFSYTDMVGPNNSAGVVFISLDAYLQCTNCFFNAGPLNSME